MRKGSGRLSLNVKEVVAKFQKAENSPVHRRGTFKIDMPFEDALRKILKAKSEPKNAGKPKS